MQIESLQIFCDVARYRSFSRAAAANHVTQSAASQAVHLLEKHLDVQLIDRSRRPLRLTPPGRRFFEGCQRLVEQYFELAASVRTAQEQRETAVQVAAIYSVGLGDMSLFVEHFRQLQPHVKVHVEYLHPDRVCERVLDGTADFGLVSFPPRKKALVALPWRDEEMVVACAPEHPLAKQPSVRPERLAGERFIGFDRNLTIRREVDRFLREHGVAVAPEAEFDSIENIKKAVEVGAGVALLPEPTLRREVHGGTLVAVPLEGCRLVRPLAVIQHRQHKLGAAAQRFLDLLRQPEAPGHNGANGHNGATRLKRGAAARNGAL
jgi:DNA-binding transcriptional LysR family regulator